MCHVKLSEFRRCLGYKWILKKSLFHTAPFLLRQKVAFKPKLTVRERAHTTTRQLCLYEQEQAQCITESDRCAEGAIYKAEG